MSDQCHRCGGPPDHVDGNAYLCADCKQRLETDDHDHAAPDDNTTTAGADGDHLGGAPTDGSNADSSSETAGWRAAAFDTPRSDEWPDALLERDAWMLRDDDKAPWAPWTNPNAPVACTHADHDEPTTCTDCHHSARYKWGSDGSPQHVHASATTALEWRDKHPHATTDLVFIQRDDDPFAFVDGDDVRDPATGDVHPAFIDTLERLGLSYADVSTSGGGIHVYYRGTLPDGLNQAVIQLDDEPFGANDDPPVIEIYDGKHVCIATGDHVPDTPTEIREWDADALEAILDEHDELPTSQPSATGRAAADLEDYDPDAEASDEIATDYRDVYRALDQLDARAVADKTIARDWLDPRGTQHRAFAPTWASSNYDGTAVFANSEVFKDTGTRGGKGGPACMAAIDAGLVSDTECPDAVSGETWAKAVDHLRDLGFPVPLYLPDATGDRDHMPYWAVRKGALELDVLDENELVKREGDDGTTYQGFPDAATYNDALAALEAEGVATGRDPIDTTSEPPTPDQYRRDPRDVDVVMEPQRAWNAASRVTPDQLDEPVSLATTTDADAWQCPETNTRVDDVARAVAIAEGLVATAEDPLADDYHSAYQQARDHYGAPLPRYLTAADAVERFDYVIGAVRELTFHHLDRDTLTCEITGEGLEVSGDAQLTLDPTPADGWRDSESGESVLVFPSGAIYDCDLNGDGDVIDTLRFVALDAGLLDDPNERLAGELFTAAYRTAREEYGAPLPRWDAGDPTVTPVLPPSDQLVDDPTTDASELDTLRGDVEDLYADLATDPGQPHVLTALPALGKTTAAIKTARSEPTTYLAPRKELMAQAATKAQEWGVSYQHLPVFSEEAIAEEIREEAVAYARDQGKDCLRDRWSLPGAASDSLFTDSDSDDVQLDRASCPTANGDHGDAWALAVHVAYHLDYTPRDIHERSTALFGRDLPCQQEQDHDCPYSQAWDDLADHDTCPDLLIGSYGHAHVESARTYYTRDQGDRRTRDPRTLVVDEYPGQAYSETFGEEALDHAVWLASALHDDVDDRQDLLERDLWNDSFVHDWLQGDAASDGSPLQELGASLDARCSAHEAATTAQELLDRYPDLLASHDLKAPLQRFVETYPEINISERASLAGAITTTVGQLPPEADGFRILQWVRQDVGDPLAASTSAPLTPDLSALPDTGELRAFVEQALQAANDMTGGATGMLRSAHTAIQGGDTGCRELAVWADHGYAHRHAHYLLEAAIRPGDDDVATIPMSNYTFGSDRDTTTAKQVDVRDRVTVLLDRNHHGAVVHAPPERRSGNGDPAPVVGLDATGREPLWAFALGEPVQVRDIHDTPRDRARCLRDVHGLQLVQTTTDIKSYEGDPSGKNLNADIALLEEISQQFAGVHAARDRDHDDIVLDDPAVITTKVVRNELEADDRATDVVTEWENYGNLKGSNQLANHQLAALLGTQHYGDHEIELVAALEGEQITRTGHGHTLDYNSPIANAYLQHMQDDQVMQAALRFARGDTGALVFAHTAALREDLPVVGEGQVIKSWSDAATTIAREWKRHPTAEFTASDVADAVDVSQRQVRRILAEFVDAGYLQRHDPGQGHANAYEPVDQPGAGEATINRSIQPELNQAPGHEPLEEYYTANVRVSGVDSAPPTRAAGGGSVLPAPAGAPTTGRPASTGGDRPPDGGG